MGETASTTPPAIHAGQSWYLWCTAWASSGTTAAETMIPGRSCRAASASRRASALTVFRRYAAQACGARAGAVAGSAAPSLSRANPSSAAGE
jgi:hypothetical protein